MSFFDTKSIFIEKTTSFTSDILLHLFTELVHLRVGVVLELECLNDATESLQDVLLLDSVCCRPELQCETRELDEEFVLCDILVVVEGILLKGRDIHLLLGDDVLDALLAVHETVEIRPPVRDRDHRHTWRHS